MSEEKILKCDHSIKRELFFSSSVLQPLEPVKGHTKEATDYYSPSELFVILYKRGDGEVRQVMVPM